MNLTYFITHIQSWATSRGYTFEDALDEIIEIIQDELEDN